MNQTAFVSALHDSATNGDVPPNWYEYVHLEGPRPPSLYQRLEFLAVPLAETHIDYERRRFHVVIGTPLYVARASTSPERSPE